MLVDVSDSRAMAQAVTQMLSSPESSARYVREGHRLLEGRFSATTVVNSYVNLYEQLSPRRSR